MLTRHTWLYLYFLPIVLVATSMAVLSYQPRNLTADRLCLLAIFALSYVLYTGKWWIVSIALSFGLLSLLLDLTPFDKGAIYDILVYCAKSRLPTPRKFDPRDFIDYNDRKIYINKIRQEIVIYNFLLTNLLMFFVCLSARFLLKTRRNNQQNQII